MNQHDRGPWHANCCADEEVNRAGVNVSEPFKGELIAFAHGGDNARLIARAPELLGLARLIADSFSRDGEFNCRSAERSLAEIVAYAKSVVLQLDGCDGCDGNGVRPHAPDHTCGPIPAGYVVVERCDTCEQFANDLDAARAWGDSAQVFGPHLEVVIALPKGGAA